MNRRFLQSLSLLCLLLGLGIPSAAGQARVQVVFSDGDFPPADWTLTLLKSKPASDAMAEQRVSRGNPGAFRRVLHHLATGSDASPSQIISLHQRQDAIFEPSVRGPIDKVCYSEDAFILSGFGEGQTTGAALWQGGRVYAYAVGPTYMPPNWLHRVSPSLDASDFIEVISASGRDLTSHPDFSASGPAITFGFFRSNSTRGLGWSLDGAIDNWRVEVNCGPDSVTQTPTRMPTSAPTLTPTSSPTPSATFTPTRTATRLPTATQTWTPTAAATSTPSPTAPPTEAAPRCVPRIQASDIVLVLDRSSSMEQANKLRDAKNAILSFVDLAQAPPDQLALVTFANGAGVAQPLGGDKARLRAALQSLITSPGTRIDLGLAAARGELGSLRHGATRGGVIVLLSDGVQTKPPASTALAEAEAAKAQGAVVFTIALGLDADIALLRQVASSPAHAFVAPTGADLADLYRRISVAIPCSSLGGQVYVDRDEDGRYDPSFDAPVANTIVNLDGPIVRAGRSDISSRGNYRFSDIPAGRYTITLDLGSLPGGFRLSGSADLAIDLGADPRMDVDFGLVRLPTIATSTSPWTPGPSPTAMGSPVPRVRIYVPYGDS